jgi:hypothetical protein
MQSPPKTSLRVQGQRRLTPLEAAVVKSGRPLRWYARRLCERGVSQRTLSNFESTLRGYLRNGNAPFRLAERLTPLLGHSLESPYHDLLLKPKRCWPQWALDAMGTPGSVSVASTGRAGIAARPATQKPVRVEPRRMTVLELV